VTFVETQQNRKSCPTCRQLSDLVIASRDFVTGSEKEALVSSYKEKLSQIPCRAFKPETKSGCSFATNCLYAHKNEQGEDLKAQSKPPRRPRAHDPRLPMNIPDIAARLARLREQLDQFTNGLNAIGGENGSTQLDDEAITMLHALRGLNNELDELGIQTHENNEDNYGSSGEEEESDSDQS